MATAIRTKTVGRIYKVLLKDRFENLLDCHLDDFVLDSRDSKRSFIAVWLWDIYAQDRLRLILLCFEPYHQICDILIQCFRIFSYCYSVNTRRFSSL